MEKYEEARGNALKNLKIADHMLTVTYPLVKDPKLLISVVENIFLSLTNSMAAILYLDNMYKVVPTFNDDFSSKYETFKKYCVDRLKIDKEYISLMQTIKGIISAHKKSKVEFAKKDRLIICNDTFDIKSIDKEKLSDYVEKTRSFVYIMDGYLKKNARLLREC